MKQKETVLSCSIRLVSMLLLLMGIGFAYSSEAWGQAGPNGSLNGKVEDQTGASVPGARITIVSLETGLTRTATADAEGRWTISVLPVGAYKVTIEAQGFKKANWDSVIVEAAVPRTLDTKMEVGEVSIEVNITDTAPLATPTTATTFRQLSGQELVQVPTSTRSFTHLLSADAGVSSDLPPVLTNGNGNISPSVNGTRTTSTSLSFNGIDATNLTSNEGSLTDNISPAPETLSEVKLQTSLYDASTGRSGGGNFQLVTRSGGNRLNGSIYHYFQNEALNANDFFFNRDGIDRPKARRNEGGFTIGGPVIKDKLFFFGGYQFTRANTGFVPTASSITVLPAALGLISGQRTAANIVAAFKQLNANFPLTEAQISPISLAILNIRNPATGDFLVRAPRANAEAVGNDTTVSPWTGGNPLVRQRNVFPAKFEQDQFTTKLDYQLSEANRLSGTFFFANFPGFDPFPDPSSLASPVTLRRDDRNRTLAISDIHTFSPTVINEVRLGYFFLNNTRSLDDPFLAITNDSVGIPNPAAFFDSSPGTNRLGHYVFRNNLSNLSWGGPNDSFNRRRQQTFSISDNVTWTKGANTYRFGGEFKRHQYDTNLPEEQATEFEKWENFTQFLSGFATEADTQFGLTNKTFIFRDISAYAATDIKLGLRTTLNLGVRWEWFGWPEARGGTIGNFDFAALTNTENPVAAFIIPKNARTTGFPAIDGAIATSIRADNNHTLNGQDLNNFAPRIGFAFSPFDSNRLVVRGGYGFFFDRPSAAFINTIFSNYPFLRESEITAPTRRVPIGSAWSQQDVNLPFSGYLPNRIQYQSNGTYVIRDGTPTLRQADGSSNPIDLATGLPAVGNISETFEFRAIDRNLRTPYIQQWNLGFQYELTPNLMVEARYVGTKGTKLLQAQAFNQGFDFNDPRTPDYLFKRFNDAYNAAYQKQVELTGNVNALRGPLRNAATERDRGVGIAFGFPNPLIAGQPLCVNGALNSTANTPVDYNLSTAITCNASNVAGGGAVISTEARGLILGFNVPEALVLQSSANSIYHGLQIGLTKRFSKGFQFNTYYTWSKSIDFNSSDPGSTAGGGKPDVPNVGFVVQGDQRNLRENRGLSDFDRTHRFSASYVYELPLGDSAFLKGWQVSGFAQIQSGTPFSIFSTEPEIASVGQFSSVSRGSGGIYRLGFGRPSLCGSIEQLRQQGSDITERYFDGSVLCSPMTVAGGYPGNFGIGNLGRNILRGPYQKRFDVGLSKATQLTERVGLEFRWDVFNAFNNVNFANPSSDLQDGTDFGAILNTIGGPRVMQFGLKLKF
ncbi:MAG: carboxypeptidase regulatory-like domain-containing protein [Acidobacteriota bacterium]|nr:MAG: carboxypeptidase regulatory-like domain-containing protein [Acidobacteriota bacterium]